MKYKLSRNELENWNWKLTENELEINWIQTASELETGNTPKMN